MLPHISVDLSSDFIEKLVEMLQKYRGETVNFDSRKARKLKGFEFPRPDKNGMEVIFNVFKDTDYTIYKKLLGQR